MPMSTIVSILSYCNPVLHTDDTDWWWKLSKLMFKIVLQVGLSEWDPDKH